MHSVRYFTAIVALLLLAACATNFEVSKRDAESGYFPTTIKSVVVKNTPISLDEVRDLLVVPNSDFLQGQSENIGYFNEVITVEELESRIIQAGLTDKVPSLRDKIGLSNAARHYKPFMWLHLDRRQEGKKTYAQLVLTDPLTSENYFVTETLVDVAWSGLSDKNNWYPMFNALIEYIEANSEAYRK